MGKSCAALRRGTVTGSLSGILGASRFRDAGSHDLLGRSLGSDTSGFVENAMVPGLQIAWPINGRQVYAFGASWTPSDTWTVDFAYNRIEIDDTQFNHTGNFADRVVGEYTGHANVVSIGATRRFQRPLTTSRPHRPPALD